MDLGLRAGPYGAGFAGLKPKRFGPKGELTLDVLRESPHGVDLGPLMPSLPERLPEGRIQLAPALLVNDLARLQETESRERSLVLIGRRHVRSNNSWMHNVPHLMKGRDRCTLMMHPDDAQRLDLEGERKVEVRSRVGAIEVPLEITDELMPGVVSLPHGFGHGRRGVKLRVAREHAGESVNDLTDQGSFDALTGNAVLNGVPVEVRAARQGDTPSA